MERFLSVIPAKAGIQRNVVKLTGQDNWRLP